MRSIVASICLLFGVAIALPVIADAGSGSGSAVVAATAPGSAAAIGSAISPAAPGSGAAIGSAISPAAPGSGSAVGSAAGSGSAAAPAPAVVPSIDENPAGFVQAAYRAATGKKWLLLAGLVLLALVWVARHGAIKVSQWFATTTGGVVLAFGISVAGTVGLAFAAGANVTPDLIVSALSTAATAAGLWQWLTKRFPAAGAAVDAVKAAQKPAA